MRYMNANALSILFLPFTVIYFFNQFIVRLDVHYKFFSFCDVSAPPFAIDKYKDGAADGQFNMW